jgi:hypothetical protein
VNDRVSLRRQFMSLVDDVCEELGYPKCVSDSEGDAVIAMEMEVGAIPFAVVHSMETAPGQVLVESTYGPLPEKRLNEVLLRLLEMNRALAETGNGAFCLDPDSGEVMLTQQCDLSAETGAGLLQTMTRMSWQSRRWKDNCFLDSGITEEKGTTDFDPLALA